MQSVLHDVSSVVTLADPIVQEIETDLKPLAGANPAGLLAALEKFLAKYEPDASKVAAKAASLSILPVDDLLHDAATFALATIAPTGTAASLLSLAVELAYAALKKTAAPLAAPSTVTAPEPVGAK